MPEGYRGVILAALGCLIAFGVGYSSRAPERQPVPEYHQAPKIEIAQSAREGNANRAPPVSVLIVESEADAIASKAREAEQRRHDANDLEAQIRAATANEQQVPLTRLAAILAFLSTCLIVWTLLETQKGSKAAEEAVHFAKTTDRAWVSHRNVLAVRTVDEAGDMLGVHVQLVWLNAGKTPALTVAMWSDYAITEDLDHLFSAEGNGGSRRTTLGPGLTLNSFVAPIAQADLLKHFNEGKHLLFWSRVEYSDVYNPTLVRESEVTVDLTFAISAADVFNPNFHPIRTMSSQVGHGNKAT